MCQWRYCAAVLLCAARRGEHFLNSNLLTECEVECLNAGVKELDFESPVLHRTLLSDQLIEAGFSDFTGAIRR